MAIYIRNVTSRPSRRRAIEQLASEVAAHGSSLLLAVDSFAMAEHAAEHGFISADALAAVFAERVDEQGAADPKPTRVVAGEGAPETRRAVERGELDEALMQETAGGAPPNVRVETEGHGKRQ